MFLWSFFSGPRRPPEPGVVLLMFDGCRPVQAFITAKECEVIFMHDRSHTTSLVKENALRRFAFTIPQAIGWDAYYSSQSLAAFTVPYIDTCSLAQKIG